MIYIDKIEKYYEKGKEFEAISLLEKFCEDNPLDLNAKFDLALLHVNTTVFADSHIFALELLNEILKTSCTDLKSVILKSHIEDMYLGYIKDETLVLIEECLENLSKSNKYYYILFLIKAFYYREKEIEKYYKLLLKYIEKDPLSSFPFYLMGEYYIKFRNKEKSEIAFRNAIKNIKSIFNNDKGIKPLDFNMFLDYFYRGVIISESQYKKMLEDIKKYKCDIT